MLYWQKTFFLNMIFTAITKEAPNFRKEKYTGTDRY